MPTEIDDYSEDDESFSEIF